MYEFEMIGAILVVLFFAALIHVQPRTGNY
jgi:hypothetical protein